MKLLILLSWIYMVSTDDVVNDNNTTIQCPTCFLFENQCYNFEPMFSLQGNFGSDIIIPKILIHAQTNILYYSYQPEFHDPEYSRVGFVNLDDPKLSGHLPLDRSHIYNFTALDLDQEKGILYLGGGDGIYQVNTNNVSDIKLYSSKGDTIDRLVFRGNVYFTKPSKTGQMRLIEKIGDNFVPPVGFEKVHVKNFVIDNTNIIYYVGGFGTFARKNSQQIILSDNNFMRGLVIDKRDNVYTWYIDGLYKVIKGAKLSDYKLKRVLERESITSIAFDKNNNMLIAFGTRLYKMNPVDMLQCVLLY